MDGVDEAAAPEYEAVAEPDSWASKAEEVPARWDQPGRSGPARAKAAITMSTAAPSRPRRAASSTERARPAARRQATAAATEPVQRTNTRSPRAAGRRIRNQSVDHGDRPAGVGEPMDPPPGAGADPAAQPAGDRDGEEHVERQRPEADPDRPVGERNGITASARPIGT